MAKKKKKGQPQARRFRFDPGHIHGILGSTREEYHRDIKPAILTDFAEELGRKGVRNPDIGVDDLGNIVFLDPRDGRILFTDVLLDSYAVIP